ncbi:hypothetical protein [Runella sp.]|uniref:hypothetical protein n=1 Tax=Runella sp. TaxID=1960881 RepID=UPI003D0B4854
MDTLPSSHGQDKTKLNQRIQEVHDYADAILLALNLAGMLHDDEPDNSLMLYVFQSRDARIKELLSTD